MSTRGEKASGITVVIPCLNEEESIPTPYSFIGHRIGGE
jgi:hypothetical protein